LNAQQGFVLTVWMLKKDCKKKKKAKQVFFQTCWCDSTH
jgi:hypothetical protein